MLQPVSFRHDPTPGLVSCVIPVYNGARFVSEAIDSVFSQTYTDHEVIVVDDGSEDDTPSVLEKYQDRILVFRQENGGPSQARNLGMSQSRGEFIAFLDADDLWVPDKTEKQLEKLRQRADLELVSGHMRSFWVPELEHEAVQLRDHPYHVSRAVLSPCTVLFRRSLVEGIGGFDESLRHGEDTDWFMRMMRSGTPYETLPELLLHRRQHQSNLTRQVVPTQDRVMELIKRNLDRSRGSTSTQ